MSQDPAKYSPESVEYYPMQQKGPQPVTGVNERDVMGSFFAEVESIQDELKALDQNINSVSELHARRLATTDDAQQASQTTELVRLASETSQLTNMIRNRITVLNETNIRSKQGDVNFRVRRDQIGGLKNSFKRSLEEYNLVEKKSRDKYRQRMERQIKIIKPDASQEEIKAAFEDMSGGQIFSQALVQSRQMGARAAFTEIQTRHQDLRKIEETIAELGQMMQDMATLVLEQDDAVITIEDNAVAAEGDMGSGLQQTQKAVKSARSARQKRWICFWILLIAAVILAIVLAITLRPK